MLRARARCARSSARHQRSSWRRWIGGRPRSRVDADRSPKRQNSRMRGDCGKRRPAMAGRARRPPMAARARADSDRIAGGSSSRPRQPAVAGTLGEPVRRARRAESLAAARLEHGMADRGAHPADLAVAFPRGSFSSSSSGPRHAATRARGGRARRRAGRPRAGRRNHLAGEALLRRTPARRVGLRHFVCRGMGQGARRCSPSLLSRIRPLLVGNRGARPGYRASAVGRHVGSRTVLSSVRLSRRRSRTTPTGAWFSA